MERGGRYRTHDLDEPTSDLEKYAREVMNAMIREGIPPTPSNFDAWFDKLLDNKPVPFRKRILKLLELEDGDDDNQGILEQHLKEAFSNIKKFLQHINLLYKNLRHLETVVEKRSFEADAIADQSAMTNLLEAMKKDIRTMTSIIKKDASELKEIYTATTDLVQDVQEHAIYDDRYGVYKKNYLLRKMAQEEKLIKEFHHESTLMLVRTNEEVVSRLKSPKIQQLVLRTVARLLLKTSRRSDTIAHYEAGVFAILMKHTSLENARLAADRLKDLVSNTNFFVGDEEIMLDVDIGIARIDLDRSTEQTIVCALEALDIAKKVDESCGICPQDVEI
ncbi:GGDEF domain-containing protein [Hydrogenimonas urashimensis]|uniref:GGDEF domain-containing protein n=1 Tax=Hydrogenimonas urashimensis TaxID=2740515 RepID=UPI001915EFF3|nr:diguanylate cyclase [Hydrogenimonas urashimensis]